MTIAAICTGMTAGLIEPHRLVSLNPWTLVLVAGLTIYPLYAAMFYYILNFAGGMIIKTIRL